MWHIFSAALRSALLMERDGNSCVKVRKRELREKFKLFIPHFPTDDQEVKVGLSVLESCRIGFGQSQPLTERRGGVVAALRGH